MTRKVSTVRIVIAVVLLLTAALSFAPAQAQSTAAHLSDLQISLWPEYDQPSVLVIYKLILASDVSLPASVVIRIPAAAGSPHAVAARQVDDLVNVIYDEQIQGDWNLISFTATVPELWVEYYDPGLSKLGDERSFTYTWPGDFRVDNFSVEVQEPINTSQITLSPNLGEGQLHDNGLVYYNAQVGSLNQGEAFELRMSYTKSGETLSAEGIEVQPAEPLTDDTSGRVRSSMQLPDNFIVMFFVGILGVTLIVGGGLWYWRSSRKDDDSGGKRRHAPGRSKASSVVEGDAIYCSQCGKRASGGDSFCRQCGSRLRR